MTDLPAAGVSGERVVPVIELGGTHVTAALVGFDADDGPYVRGARSAGVVAAEPAEQIVERITACASGVAAPEGASWGVAVPGPFDYTRGVGLYRDVGKFDALHGVDLRQTLLQNLPSRPADIVFLNDAEAFLLGEWRAGAARGHDRPVGLTLGTGIGSAFLAHGLAVTTGPTVPPQGSVHLLSVAGRPLEDVVSSRAIRRRYAAAASGLELEVIAIAERARAGEPAARDALDGALTVLGRALAPWLETFRATVVVVGGSIARSWDLVAGPLVAGIRSWSTASADLLAVVPADKPQHAPLIGAACQVARLTGDGGVVCGGPGWGGTLV